jgi:zinc D-Ala-D-Ala carboxypeptidase
MRLSENFTLAEFTKSQTAIRNGIPNDPTTEHLEAMKVLCEFILEPLRAHFGRPVRLSSGYRSTRLNRAVGGSTTSQHSKGEAADLEIPGVANDRVAKWIRGNLPFDQVILEFYHSGDPNSGWVHVSYGPRNRRQALTTSDGRVYKSGLVL